MRVTVKGHTYQYDHEDLTLEEGDMLQLQAGIGYLDFANPDLKDFRTWRAIIWLCRMRDGETSGEIGPDGYATPLRYKDVNAKYTEVTFTPDEEKPEDDDVPKDVATRKGNGAGPKTSTIGQPKRSDVAVATG